MAIVAVSVRVKSDIRPLARPPAKVAAAPFAPRLARRRVRAVADKLGAGREPAAALLKAERVTHIAVAVV